jgi:hypothetical protein
MSNKIRKELIKRNFDKNSEFIVNEIQSMSTEAFKRYCTEDGSDYNFTKDVIEAWKSGGTLRRNRSITPSFNYSSTKKVQFKSDKKK